MTETQRFVDEGMQLDSQQFGYGKEFLVGSGEDRLRFYNEKPQSRRCASQAGVTITGFSLRMSFKVALLAIVTLLTLSNLRANAQGSTAQITGTVHDATGAFIPGAQVSVVQTSTATNTTVTSNDSGLFSLPALAVGSYTVTVTAPGFATYRQTDLVLSVSQVLNLNITLAVGASDQVVEVTAANVAIDATTPAIQNTVEEKVVRDLPLNGRNPASLTYTTAGVTDATLNIGAGDTSSTVKAPDAANPQDSAPSVHGARPGGTYFSLDGANNTDPYSIVGGPFPNPDATGEFSVVTGTFGSRYASAPGGAINIVSKSGTNQIHGTVFEFIRNGYFNAENAISASPDILKRNQFGFAVGAPILHDRLFVFGSYQGNLIRNSTPAISYLPTPAQRAGNFGTFQIPAALISPSMQNLLKAIPFGDPVTGELQYQIPENSTDQQGVVKLDYDLKQHRLFARAFYDRYVLTSSDPTPTALALAAHQGYIQPWASLAIGDTWTKGSWLYETRAAYIRALSTQKPSANPMSYSALGIGNLSGAFPDPGLWVVQVVGNFTTEPGDVSQFPRNEVEGSEGVTVVKGKHQIAFGGSYRHISLSETNYVGENPYALFYGVNSLIYGELGVIPNATLNPLADLILGAPYVFGQGDGIFENLTGHLIGVYGEDNYKATNHLTLTAGLRWDPFLPYTIQDQKITCFVPGEQSSVFRNSLPGLVFPGDPGCPKNGVPKTMNELEPSVGVAYQLGNSGRTAIRAGYGKYTLQLPEVAYVGFSNQPFERTVQYVQPFLSIDNLYASAMATNPFSGGFHAAGYVPASNTIVQPGQRAATFNQNFKPGYVQQWSLSVQQLLSKADSIDVAYVGTSGTHLDGTESINTPVYSATATASNEQARRPYPQFQDIYSLASNATSSYNGVDVTYRHSGKLLTINSAFSYSKALDDNSQPGTSDTLVFPTTDPSLRRGRSDFDQNLVFRTTGTYTTPVLEGRNPLIRTVLGSWGVSGLLTLDAGQPFSITDSDDKSVTGLGLDYADRVPGVPVYLHGRLNEAAFTDNAPGTFGNSGRNAYRGPSYKELDTALLKTFPIYDRVKGTFRAEAFNLFNHPNFPFPNHAYGPQGTTAAQTFGTYQTPARDPRILQFSLKIAF